MRVTSKGQVTIPRDLRELAGIAPNSEVVFAFDGGKLTIMPKGTQAALQEQERLDKVLAALDRLEGTGEQTLDANAVMAMTRDR